MIASTGSLRFVDEIVGLRRLLGDGVDGVLQDLALLDAALDFFPDDVYIELMAMSKRALRTSESRPKRELG